jgi:hypothetical protein
MFDPFNVAQIGNVKRTSLGQEGVFADCEDVEEIHAYHWPTVADCDFTQTLGEIDRTLEAGQAVLSGTWGSIGPHPVKIAAGGGGRLAWC